MFSMDYFVEDSLKLQDMIDNDIRSGEYYFNEFGEDLHCSQGLSIDGFDSTLDSEMSADGRSGWMSTHLLNSSADLDCLNGILVNPRTGLPNSISDAPDSPISMSPSSTDEDVAISVTSDDKMSIEGMKVSLPMQVVTSSSVNSSEAADINAISVPTPSPSPSSQSQIYLPSEGEADTADSPKPKSKSKNSKSLNSGGENTYPKPAYSYSCLIAMALKNSKMGSLPVNEIYDFMTENFPYFKTAPNGWKNSVRHNLSLNKCFEKIEKPAGNNSQRKGYLWAMNPAKIEKMEEELHKWGSKDPAAIRKSMAKPERLELIEKGELRNTDSESEVENMNVSQTEDEEEYVKDEKENEVKVQVTNLGNDLLPGEFVALSDSVNIEACLPELDMQKGLWDNMYEDRMQHSFLSDSPIRPLSPKNSETMEEESETCPSAQRSYVHASYVYKVASRISLQGQSNGPTSASKGRTCNV